MSEFPDFYRNQIRKARKSHRCCECRGTIQPGETYHYHSGKWDGDVETFAMCVDCNVLIADLNDGRPFEERTTFNELLEDCSNTGDEWLSKMVGIMAKRGAKIPDWATERLNEAKEDE